MANNISIAIGQYNGTYTVSGDIAATGYYTITEGAVLQSFSGEVSDLGAFSAVLDNSTMKYKLEPSSSETASDLMDAVVAIQALIEGGFAVDVPVISGDELFSASTQVSISVPTRSAVYYTTNGDTPTSESSAYSEPFTLDATATVKAIAIKDGVSSEVASATFTKLAAPTISGTTPFAETTSVTMSGPEGATIHYTTDGSTPTSDSSTYSEALTLSATTTVKAVSVKSGVTSAAATKKFTKES